MQAVKAYYDGRAFVPFGKVKFSPKQQAIIVVEDNSAADKDWVDDIIELNRSVRVPASAEALEKTFELAKTLPHNKTHEKWSREDAYNRGI